MFWADERKQTVCCQFADDEQLTCEAELFNCQTCPVANALETLYPENAAAWQLFHQVATRFVVDAGLAGAVFRRLTDDLERDEVEDVLERLSIIYDVLIPQKKG